MRELELKTVFDKIKPEEEKIVVLRKSVESQAKWYNPLTWLDGFETKYIVGPAKWKDNKIKQKGYITDSKEQAKYIKENFQKVKEALEEND